MSDRYVMVPEKATAEMLVAGSAAALDGGGIADIHAAMIAARPSVGEDVVERLAAVMWADTNDTSPADFADSDPNGKAIYLSNARAILSTLTQGG